MVAEIILALDLPLTEALPLLDKLPELRWVKVGPILFNREGPALIGELRGRGLKVFLDLKWHDIPNTVAGAVIAARELDVSLATVHTLGGAAMLEAARRAAGGELGLLGVTVLTSHDAESYEAAVGRAEVSLLAEVGRLADIAVKAGLRGIVCSPLEAEAVRRSVGTAPWIVVPGIRRPSDPAGDQARTASPAEAVRRGATHLVVGRPILQAPDPAAAFGEILDSAKPV
jgi:orotidine-5'-phosphate decarboxylase